MGTQRFVKGLLWPYYRTTNYPNSRHYSPISDCSVSLPSFAEPLPSIGSPRFVECLPIDQVLTAGLQLAFVRSPYRVIRPLLPLHISEILLARTYTLKVRPSTPPWRLQRALTLCGTGESYRHAITISMLPDDVLLEIFDFYQKNHAYDIVRTCKWHILAHVCQSWRQIVLASPHRLNLQIPCTSTTPVRKNLGIWPAFPIIIDHDPYSKRGISTPNNEDNVIAALEHSDRVSYLRINVTESQLGKIVTAMQEPFPSLTRLEIFSLGYGNAPVLPAEFLGGSAPCLQTIYLRSIPFPTLPTLLLSTGDLVTLELYNIPRTGYISPDAMVVGLAALPRLETIIIGFQLATPPRKLTYSPPVTRTVLP